MSVSIRYITAGVLLVFTALLLFEGIDLWVLGTTVDGDGIGLSFLGIEINDKVAVPMIPIYAAGFIVLSAITLVTAIFLMIAMKKAR